MASIHPESPAALR
ncbi:hypothetical protein STRIP9103_06995, partial [Streptomyces ipomoeae 91-03]